MTKQDTGYEIPEEQIYDYQSEGEIADEQEFWGEETKLTE